MPYESFPPVFSVIIPTYRRPGLLQKCLSSFCDLDYPREQFEIIVVDDGGSQSSEVAVPFRQSLRIRVIRQENAGPARARNRGVALAEGRFVAFTDDDCAPDREWLLHLEKVLQRNPLCAVGGKTINALADNPYSATSQLILDIVYAHYNADPEEARFFATNNVACPTDLFRKVGGFNEGFRTSEDREFCDRWIRSGLKLVYAPEAMVFHSHPLDLKGMWIQHFNYGKGAFQFYSTRKQLGLRGLQIDMGFYRKLWVSSFREFVPSRGKLSLLLLTSQIANAFGYFAAKYPSQNNLNKLPCV